MNWWFYFLCKFPKTVTTTTQEWKETKTWELKFLAQNHHQYTAGAAEESAGQTGWQAGWQTGWQTLFHVWFCVFFLISDAEDSTCCHISVVWSCNAAFVGCSAGLFSFMWWVKDLLSCLTVNTTCYILHPWIRGGTKLFSNSAAIAFTKRMRKKKSTSFLRWQKPTLAEGFLALLQRRAGPNTVGLSPENQLNKMFTVQETESVIASICWAFEQRGAFSSWRGRDVSWQGCVIDMPVWYLRCSQDSNNNFSNEFWGKPQNSSNDQQVPLLLRLQYLSFSMESVFHLFSLMSDDQAEDELNLLQLCFWEMSSLIWNWPIKKNKKTFKALWLWKQTTCCQSCLWCFWGLNVCFFPSLHLEPLTGSFIKMDSASKIKHRNESDWNHN